MAEFLKTNGKFGQDLCFHTATGYQCVANHDGNRKGHSDRITFFARHVVGDDGHPYTEAGLKGLEDYEKSSTLSEIKKTLEVHGFAEVSTLGDHVEKGGVYEEHVTADADSIAIRVNSGQVSISRIIDILGQWIAQASKEFVIEQETVPDVLFQSIFCEMGEELKRGPGGEEYAVKKAHQLAISLEQGYWTNQ